MKLFKCIVFCCRFRGYFNHAVCVWNCALLRRQKPVELGAETPPMLARYSHSYSRSRSGAPLFATAFARVDFSRTFQATHGGPPVLLVQRDNANAFISQDKSSMGAT
jgi:hypothetical protein